MKKIFVLFLIISCNNKPIGSEQLEKIKEDSAIQSREKDLYAGIDSSYLKTASFAPIEITFYEIIGYHINVKTKNKTNKTIDGIRIVALFYNNFNEPIPSPDKHNIQLQSQSMLRPGEVSELLTFSVDPDYSSSTKAKFYVSEVHFADNSTWNFKNYVK